MILPISKMGNLQPAIWNTHILIFVLEEQKAIPNKKIITGPAFLYIEDIPTPLFVPLGYFPNTKNQSSGILFSNLWRITNAWILFRKRWILFRNQRLY